MPFGPGTEYRLQVQTYLGAVVVEILFEDEELLAVGVLIVVSSSISDGEEGPRRSLGLGCTCHGFSLNARIMEKVWCGCELTCSVPGP